MKTIDRYVDGIDKPLIGNSFYQFTAYMHGKPHKIKHGPSNKHKRKKACRIREKAPSLSDSEHADNVEENIYIPDALPDQHFHMDYGFVCGSQYCIKTEEGQTGSTHIC